MMANKVIKQMVEHMFSEDVPLQFKDYMAIRAVFRHLGGLWVSIEQGDVQQIEKLSKIVIAWGLMPEHQNQKDQVV